MRLFILVFFYFLYIGFSLNAQTHKIIESTDEHIIIYFNFDNAYKIVDTVLNGKKFSFIKNGDFTSRNTGDPWLPDYDVLIGIPFNSVPTIELVDIQQQSISDIFILPLPEEDPQIVNIDPEKINKNIYYTNNYFPVNKYHFKESFVFRYIKVLPLSIAPVQFNPVVRQLNIIKRLVVKVKYNSGGISNSSVITDRLTDEFIKNNLINKDFSKTFISKQKTSSGSITEFWYDPNKQWIKLFLNKKGVYRITFEQLINLGISAVDLESGKFAVFNEGKSIPLDIVDNNNNGLFDDGDYFQFIGKQVKPSPFSKLNIYNKTNTYWFTYQSDSVHAYKSINGFPSDNTGLIFTTQETLTWEKDIIYDQLGWAGDLNRNFWYWEQIQLRNYQPFSFFDEWFKDSIAWNINWAKPQAKLRVNMHGVTNSSCQYGHNAFVKWNFGDVGQISWDGQKAVTLESDFNFGISNHPDSIKLLPDSNYIIVGLNSNTCFIGGNDYVDLNWIELDYWRMNRIRGNYYSFFSPPDRYGKNNYYLWRYFDDEIKIYIPQRSEMISNADVRLDADQSVYFVDTVYEKTEYFCVSPDYYLIPDSLQYDKPSNLRNLRNEADYIIITHPLFLTEANRLADYRNSNLSGFDDPRIMVVEIDDIFDEFSAGIYDPDALYKFVEYAFENYQSPAPSYVVLFGDLSTDYRKILPASRDNFMPTLMYYTLLYGPGASDNQIVCVSGTDTYPDLSVGRISCETIEEAKVLVDKIINYPANDSKLWKQNILLLSSGLDADDEALFGFNDANILLQDTFVTPIGLETSKVFRYPNKEEYIPFQGESVEIRNEINKGAALVNYYGHGGGYQWDFVFVDDDIRALQNGEKLPFVISVTCYTAQFNNQKVFGEIFNEQLNKGSIAFIGSSGLTYWFQGKKLGEEIFRHIFTNGNYVIGDAILLAKNSSGTGSLMDSQRALTTLLGDPAIELALPKNPEFLIESSMIDFSPQNPVKGDTIKIIVKIRNLGLVFPGDSVSVDLYLTGISENNLLSRKKLSSFGLVDSVQFSWITEEAGLFNLFVEVNGDNNIFELDQSDNYAQKLIPVYNFGEPNIVIPYNGAFFDSSRVKFILIDAGNILDVNFSYVIEIDTTELLNSSAKILSPVLTQKEGLVEWISPELQPGEYFWKAIVTTASDTNFSMVRSFSIGNQTGSGYLSQGKLLNLFSAYNMIYSPVDKALILNNAPLPPRPKDNDQLIENFNITLPADGTAISNITTDGTYLYFAHLPYWNNGNPTKIYKTGTGLNGTIKGLNYGTVGNILIYPKNQIFYHSDGFIYAATGDDSTLLKINPVTADTSRVFLPVRMLPSVNGMVKNNGFYLTSDGNLVYNLCVGSADFPDRYIVRIFDPSSGWHQVGNDIMLLGLLQPGFTSFFVSMGYVFTFEAFDGGFMRRYRLSDGFFEEEWLTLPEQDRLITWTYDWQNEFVWGGRFRPGSTPYVPAFYKFLGIHTSSKGEITTEEIGPAQSWDSISYEISDLSVWNNFGSVLFGKNILTNSWDTLFINLSSFQNLEFVDASVYPNIKLHFSFTDSAIGIVEPMKFKFLKIQYNYLPEYHINTNYFSFSEDSVLQGIPISATINVRNLVEAVNDSITVKLFLIESSNLHYEFKPEFMQQGLISYSKEIKTDTLLYFGPLSPVNIYGLVESNARELYYFNNLAENRFFVVRDSVKPSFSITFDGREILEGDIISSKPVVSVTLEDNSPLPLTPSLFTIVHNNVPLKFDNPQLTFNYTPYPNSRAEITWTPELEDGRHVLEVLAKDSSGNFFDSTSNRSVFYVFNNADLLNVYNYPNPFSENTYFTFEVRGTDLPEELRIKIYTIAGRLIREINIPQNQLRIGFNQIYWDGRDEDGDEIANGLYFYKIISSQQGETRTSTQKLAKIK